MCHSLVAPLPAPPVSSMSKLDPGQAGDLESLVQRLCQLPGTEPWTAHYVAMHLRVQEANPRQEA